MAKRTITTILVILVFILLVITVFINDILPLAIRNEYGSFIYVPLAVIFVVLIGLIVFVSKYKAKPRKNIITQSKNEKKEVKKTEEKRNNNNANEENINSKKELEEKRNSLVAELKEAENQFLKNKISKNTFDKITKDKNAELIKIEAKIDSDKKTRMSSEDAIILEDISKDKKDILKGLLEEKRRKVHELNLSEKGYLKRKIDEKTYKKISEEVKAEIISIEGKIKAIQKSDKIDKIKKEMINGAKEIANQRTKSKKRIAAEPKTFEDEVFEQMGFK